MGVAGAVAPVGVRVGVVVAVVVLPNGLRFFPRRGSARGAEGRAEKGLVSEAHKSLSSSIVGLFIVIVSYCCCRYCES